MNSERFCRHCQQLVSVPSTQRKCPHCGGSLFAGMHAPTVDLDMEAMQEAAEPVDPQDEFLHSEFDKYYIERFLGQGGMARVYLARHLALERPCAIKVLRLDRNRGNDDSLEAFLAEARAAAALVHPHVVTIHSLGHADGRHFIEMEYVPGRCLARLLESAGRFDMLTATKFMLQISSALDAAHQQGMIHRDIKPANVMVTRSQDAKLADFGLAKQLNRLDAEGHLLSGTPAFMAPELFAGKPAARTSDVYAMGVTYFALLTGQLPFESHSITDLIRSHRHEPPDLLTLRDDVSEQVAALVRTCLDKHPASRFRDAGELHQALRAAYGTLRDLKSLIEEALANAPVTIEGRQNHFQVRVSLPQARTQLVHVEALNGSQDGQQVIRIFSVAGPVCEDYLERALELNATLPHGALAIEEVAEQRCFVIVNTYPRATCDPEEVRESVLSIAAHADEIEHQLTGDDLH